MFSLANITTFLRFVLLIPYVWLLTEGRYGGGLGLAVFIALGDGVDGFLARLLHTQSKKGAVFDSIADATFVVLSLFLFLFNGFYSLQVLFILLTPRILIGSLALIRTKQKKPWNIEHLWSDKIVGASYFALIAYLLGGFPYATYFIYTASLVIYIGTFISIKSRWKHS